MYKSQGETGWLCTSRKILHRVLAILKMLQRTKETKQKRRESWGLPIYLPRSCSSKYIIKIYDGSCRIFWTSFSIPPQIFLSIGSKFTISIVSVFTPPARDMCLVIPVTCSSSHVLIVVLFSRLSFSSDLAVVEKAPTRCVCCNVTGRILSQDFRSQYNHGVYCRSKK